MARQDRDRLCKLADCTFCKVQALFTVPFTRHFVRNCAVVMICAVCCTVPSVPITVIATHKHTRLLFCVHNYLLLQHCYYRTSDTKLAFFLSVVQHTSLHGTPLKGCELSYSDYWSLYVLDRSIWEHCDTIRWLLGADQLSGKYCPHGCGPLIGALVLLVWGTSNAIICACARSR